MKSMPRFSWLLVFFLLIIQSVFSQAFQLSDTIAPDPSLVTGKLPNGLTYYIRDNGSEFNNMQIRVVVNAGSLLEDDDQQGLAHFMEHMNFNGLKHFPKDELLTYLESSGLKPGADLNANTSYDATNYILWLTTEDLKKINKGFTIAEDWANNALLDPAEIYNERKVVLEESRMHKNVYDRLRNFYFPDLINHSKYAYRVPIGKDSIISGFDPETLNRYFKTWYRPDLTAVIAVGNLDVASTKKEIIKHFSDYSNPENEIAKPADLVLAPRAADESLVFTDKELQNTIFELFGGIRKKPVVKTWADLRQSVIQSLFALMLRERLENLGQQTSHSIIDANASFNPLIKGFYSFNCNIIVANDSVKEAIYAFMNMIKSIEEFGFLPSEMERAKNKYAKQNELDFLNEKKTSSAIFAEEYSDHFTNGTTIISIDDKHLFIKNNLKRISLQELNETAKSFLSEKGKFALLIAPEKYKGSLPGNEGLLKLLAEAGQATAKPFVEQTVSASLMDHVPEKGTIVQELDNKSLKTKNLIFKNGITVTLRATDFKNDDIQLDAWRFGGSHKFGLVNKQNATYASMMVRSMGIKGFSKTDLDKFLSGKRISVDPYINPYEDGVEGKCSANDLSEFLQLIYCYFTAPVKDYQAFQFYISQQKSVFQNAKASPTSYFMDTTLRFQYQNNPWGNYIPTTSDFDNINLDTAFSIYQKIFSNPYGMHFTFVGNLDFDKVIPLLETYLGSLPTFPIENSFTDEGLRPLRGVAEIRIRKGESKQSQVGLLFTGDAEVQPIETLKLNFLCEVLNIRIMEKLREQMGGIYAASVNPVFNKRPYGHYSINIRFTCGEENIDKLTDALLGIITDLRENGVEKKYLTYVKEMMIKHHGGQMHTNEYWLQTLSGSWINQQDPEWALSYYNDVDGISSKDLEKTAKRYFDMNNYLKEILVPE